MSLILDALKKLDREKSFLRKRTPDISDGILRSDSARPRRTLMALVAVVAAGITLGLVMGVGFFWKNSKRPVALPAKPQVVASVPQPADVAQASPRPPAKAPTADLRPENPKAAPASKPAPETAPLSVRIKTPPPAPVKPQSDPPAPVENIAKPAVQPISPAVTPSSGGPKASLPKPVAPSGPAPQASPSVAEAPALSPETPKSPPALSVPPTLAAPQPESSRKPAAEETRAPAKVKGAEIEGPPMPSPTRRGVSAVPPKEPVSGEVNKKLEPPPAMPRSAPELKISGIVWHEEPSKRRAVINGNFASEGSVVDGVTIVEIHPTKVRFSQNGRFFEISAFH